MGRVGRKRQHHSIRDNQRRWRTRARTKDLDQIQDDLETPEKFENQPVDVDLPGLGQHYCIECSKYFVTENSLAAHIQSKIHKKRVKLLKEPAFTQKEAEAAAGLFTDNGKAGSTGPSNPLPAKPKSQTQAMEGMES
ncbi:uncharacterized protein BJ171DRAFT_492109 [Polychytrium aggregatum]|uniref:uncharacterized protein n=1 Tax=Polychytrium aggregatum TaxID=110093 RepID=UPI0022FE4A04|nr:uncharacterized protein BJ171DRAFT_492109 [Polychytrium aggregatum]KAI9207932.1 hypothetical protein BJ171DRAFT_492109 [Polychytrium aggregatum]